MGAEHVNSWSVILSSLEPWRSIRLCGSSLWDNIIKIPVFKFCNEMQNLNVTENKNKLALLDKEISSSSQSQLLYMHFYLSLIEYMASHKLVYRNLNGGEALVEMKVRNFLDNVNDRGHFPSLSSDDGLVPALIFIGKYIPLKTFHAQVSGVPRSILLRMNMFDKFRMVIYVICKMRGRRPVLEFHLPRMENKHLTVELVIQDYILAGKILEANRDLVGVLQCNWFIDPALKSISPYLAKIGKLAAENGALVLCVGQDAGAIADATRKSMTRRRLYEQGSYKPKRFIRLWSRSAIFKYCKNMEATLLK